MMRYNTKDEIEATGQWLLRVNSEEVSEELLYVPSQLSKLGLAPIDVVDRLDYLRNRRKPEVAVPLTLDYDSYGAWEWAEPIEKMVEDAILAIFDSEPELPSFNDLALFSRPKRRTRGKKARTVVVASIPSSRAEE